MESKRAACNICGCLALESTLNSNHGACMACARAAVDKSLDQLNDTLTKTLGTLYVSNPLLLPRNKNTQYKEMVLTYSLGVAEAFDELQISNVNLVNRYHANPEHFYIAAGDLTDTGATFAQTAFQKWQAKADRWKPDSKTVAKFRQSLAKEFAVFQSKKTS